MSTKIVLGMDATTRDGATTIYVEESFDEVMEKYWPMKQASSSLEGRENATFTVAGTDRRILIKTPSIVLVEEDCNE